MAASTTYHKCAFVSRSMISFLRARISSSNFHLSSLFILSSFLPISIILCILVGFELTQPCPMGRAIFQYIGVAYAFHAQDDRDIISSLMKLVIRSVGALGNNYFLRAISIG